MRHQIHRVRRQPPAPVVMPKDKWVGPVFVEADGTELTSTWQGYDPIPQLTGDWPQGMDKDCSVPARIHIPKGRS